MVAPLELLAPDENYIPSVFEKHWGPILGSAFGFTAACFANWGIRKPVFSGIHKHVILIVGSVFIVDYFNNKRNLYFAERDAVLRRYIELHPEDFPTPERKKYADVLDAWVPIR